jgi:hypothetical protein
MNQPDLAAALAACLARIEAGDSPASVLVDYPSLASELAPLIATAAAVTQLPPALPRPGYRSRLAGELTQLEGRLAAERIAEPAGPRFGTAALVVAAVLLGTAALLSVRALGLGRPAVESSQDPAPVGLVASPAELHRVASPVMRQLAPASPRQAPPAVLALAPADGSSQSTSDDGQAGTVAPARANSAPLRPRADPPIPAAEAAVSPAPAEPVADPAVPGEAPEDEPEEASAPVVVSGPAPIASPTAIPPATVSGRVLLGARPLVSVTVEVFLIPDGAPCLAALLGEPLATAQTNADGSFTLSVPRSERRLELSARGGPHCLPRRWHTGPNTDADEDPCADAVAKFSLPPTVDEAQSMDILFAAADASPCPHP